MRELDNIYKIISNTLNNTKYEYNIVNEKEFIEYLYTQGLLGLITDNMKEIDLSDVMYQKLMSLTMPYLIKDVKQLDLIDKLSSLFSENEIDYVFLKGSHLKKLYPKSYYRGMGDIDVLVRREDLEKVNKLLSTNDIKLVSRTLAHNVYIDSNKVNLEIHGGINDPSNKIYQSFLNKVFDYVEDNKLSPEYELVYLVYHLTKHLKAGGIGIRSILDIGIYYNYYEKDINKDLLNDLLEEVNLKVLFNNLIYLNNKLFNYNFIHEKVSEDTSESLLEYIINAGVHGSTGMNQMDSRTVGRGRVKLILQRAFPSFKEMKGYYPSLKYFFILLPFYYLFRLIKLILNPKNYKKVKDIKDSNNKQLEKLFNNLKI